MPFLHAAREMAKDYPTVNVMVVYLPFLRNVGELKTKPAQHAIARLREIGIVPDFLVTRNEIPIDKPRIEGLARRSFVDPENIIDDPDMDNIYALPLMFEERQFAVKILSKFGKGSAAKGDLKKWKAYINNLEKPKKSVKIALVGKYVKHGSHDHKDVYVSVLEALKHGGAENKVKVEVEAISSEELQGIPKLKINERLKGFDGIVIPQGWGSRGYPGKINAIEYARVNKIPYLGLCFGMQMAVIEFARNVLKLKDANSQEIDKKTKHPVIHIMPEQVEYLAKGQYGGTIRLGAWPCVAKSGSKLEEIYGEVDGKAWGEVRPGATRGKILKQVQDDGVGVRDDGGVVVWERHRHRYEFNNEYREKFESKGMKISGLSPDGELVEAIEIKDHPFFVGTQYHPEYLSRPLSPHPLFVEFIKAAKK
jgi:CTP synthase